MGLRGRVVLVTGASSGIGRETARRFAERGDVVVGSARREARLRALAEECRGLGAPAADWLAGDLGEPAFAEGLVGEVVARHGRLDVLVNNAGMPKRASVFALSPADAERVMEVNFLSCVRTTLAAIPVMLRQGAGCIVNVSSFTAKLVPPRESLYAASKWALAGFSEGLWSDLAASGIHVALVTPGPIDTEIWEHGPASAYRGRRHPPRLVADAILDAVERRRHEVTVPRRSPPLLLARLLRLVAPSLVRAGMRRMDPVEPPRIAPGR
jgi:short-subunit dehydrogenase